MKERAFEKEYNLSTLSSTFKRLTSRMKKEFTEVYGYYDSELDRVIADIIAERETEYENCHKYIHENTSKGYTDYDEVSMEFEMRVRAVNSRDDYGDNVYYVSWYFFSSEKYTKWTGRKQITGNSYTDIRKKGYEARGKYRYFAYHRPPSECVLPDDFVSFDYYGMGCDALGESTFDRELTPAECAKYGLELDKHYDEEKNNFFKYITE